MDKDIRIICLSEDYLKRLLSVTYVLENDIEILAYFSVSNDKIAIPDSDKSTWRKNKGFVFS